MGATVKYKLPWPELTDSADGPKGYQNLANATEAALVTETAYRLLLQQSAVGGVNVTTNASGIVTITFPIAFKTGTKPAVVVNTLSPNSGAYVLNLDGTIATGGSINTKFGLRVYKAFDGSALVSGTIAIVWHAIGQQT